MPAAGPLLDRLVTGVQELRLHIRSARHQLHHERHEHDHKLALRIDPGNQGGLRPPGRDCSRNPSTLPKLGACSEMSVFRAGEAHD